MEFEYITRIKELKKEKGINTEQLSALCDIPVGTLSKILSGVSDSVKLSNIASLCHALGVSLDWLVFGIPENHNNYTLNEDEIRLIEDYRTLDEPSRDFVKSSIALTRTRAAQEKDYAESVRRFSPTLTGTGGKKQRREGVVLPETDSFRRERRGIVVFDLPVSAGPGEYLDEGMNGKTISIPVNDITSRADFAVRINGDSMEPKFHDGDYLLVEKTDAVEVGDLGIFTLDGAGFFKMYGGDHLKSLNPSYRDILLKDYQNVLCCGRVIGKLKKSTMR